MKYTTLGIICAMEEEKTEVIRHLSEVRVVLNQAGLVFEAGKAGNLTVYVVTAGIGKVNSAMCSQIMIDSLNPDALLNIGVAGALDPGLEQGDVVLSKEAQEHDFDCSALGDPKGVIPRMETSVFPADAFLSDIAGQACREMGLNYRLGKVVSGDQFIGSGQRKNELVSEFGGTCAEMEGAAMAHVCYLNRKPWLIIRSISDKADGEADLSYPEFKDLAARRAGELFKCILGKLQ